MDLDELQSVRDRERQTDQLQQLRESFYADAGSFVADLRAERDRVAERVDDPYAPEATRLNNEIETAIQLVEDIQEGRIGKIVKAASLDAAGLPANVEGMTAEEQDLFDTLVQDIRDHRNRVLGIVEDEGTTTSQDSAGENTDAESDRDHPAALEDPVPAVEGSAEAESTPASALEEGVASPPDDETAADQRPEASTAGSPDQPTETGPDDSDDEPQSTDDEGTTEGETPAAGAMGGSADSTTPRTGETTSTPEKESTATLNEAQTDSVASTNASSAGPGGGDTRSRVDSGTGGSTGPDGADGPPGESYSDGQGATDTPTESGATSAGGSDESPEAAASAESAEMEAIDRTTVLVTDEIDTFVGFDDCDYDLEPTDVVALPSTNADILVDQGVARRLSPK